MNGAAFALPGTAGRGSLFLMEKGGGIRKIDIVPNVV